MAKVGSWSTTPGNNNSTPPDGWPEGQLPSTINDCAREMMASIRTAFNDLQFIDQGLAPTFIDTTHFSVTGNQTSAIHAGRRLKIFDATAGVATTIYATVVTASFTAITTIEVANDGGQLTTSLSSFAISIISNANSLINPLNVSVVNAGSISVSGSVKVTGAANLGSLSVGGSVVIGNATTIGGTLTVSGAVVVKNTLSVGSQIIAINIYSYVTAKFYGLFNGSAGGIQIFQAYGISAASRSALGVFRLTFTSTIAATSIPVIWASGGGVPIFAQSLSVTTVNIKFSTVLAGGTATDAPVINVVAFAQYLTS